MHQKDIMINNFVKKYEKIEGDSGAAHARGFNKNWCPKRIPVQFVREPTIIFWILNQTVLGEGLWFHLETTGQKSYPPYAIQKCLFFWCYGKSLTISFFILVSHDISSSPAFTASNSCIRRGGSRLEEPRSSPPNKGWFFNREVVEIMYWVAAYTLRLLSSSLELY